ncbi:DNA translocase FtsK [Defluviitalea phaphyphila]|uniref:DNA translocase FtsK n=1 Tax=Defluviitalea phaphyphila TaxID=1473580 RepID=UPI000731357C|nr:DNA translocase FtsK [Defluviitalea phaphyphila]
MGRKRTVSKKQRQKLKVEKTYKGVLSQEIKGVLIFALALIYAVSIYTNKAGIFGNFICKISVGIIGIGAYILPILMGIIGILILSKKTTTSNKIKIVIFIGMIILISTFIHIINFKKITLEEINFWALIKHYYDIGSWRNGGVIGGIVGSLLFKILGVYGSYIVIITLFIILFILLTGRSFIDIIMAIFNIIKKYILRLKEAIENYHLEQQFKNKQRKENSINKKAKHKKNAEKISNQIIDNKEKNELPINLSEKDEEIQVLDFAEKKEKDKGNKKDDYSKKEINKTDDENTTQIMSNINNHIEYKFPSIEFLQNNTYSITASSKKLMINNAKKLEETLLSFGVEAKVLQISRGPTVTRYELQPSQGVKVSKIVNLADDIALNLAASGIRIEAPIPGKAAIGIEIPNKEVQPVFLREVIEDEEFIKFPSKLAFALGKDISGKTVVADIARMPHLLIAGATGSGKSVCINTLITSILYKANPNEVKLLMIDPKVVELSVYNGIPHLMIPVVTDPKKAAGALNWAVQEMTNRYKLFAENNVRDIKGYNNMKREQNTEEANKEIMPQIVIIIDELADLMMTAPGEVEDAICRLAQMARAAGIHLVIATQRPSVDVITGVIKANIPSRLAFAVSSGTDSRTILDMTGAEKLLGKGDMLFYPVGASKPIRIQGAFISDKEVEKIVESIKVESKVEYNQDIIEEITTSNNLSTKGEEVDEYLEKAIEMVIEKEKASISMLQRYLRVGFNRAARIMEEMEKRGIVGPDEGSKPRKVLITKEEFEKMKSDTGQKASNL